MRTQECCAFGRAGLLSIWTRRAAEHVEVSLRLFSGDHPFTIRGPFDFAQGSWDAQGCCAFGRAGLLCIWIRKAAEHVEVPCGHFLMTTLLQYAAPSTSLRDPGRKPCSLDAGTCPDFRPKNCLGNSCIGGLVNFERKHLYQ